MLRAVPLPDLVAWVNGGFGGPQEGHRAHRHVLRRVPGRGPAQGGLHRSGRCRALARRPAARADVRHSGQSEFWMISTKSERWKPGSKWASTSSFMVPNVVSG